MKRSLFFVILLLSSCLLTTYANEKISLNIFLNESDRQSVLDNKIITSVYLNSGNNNNKNNCVIPRTAYITGNYSDYELIVIMKAFIPYSLRKNTSLDLYNILSAYSRFTGVRYYSKMDKEIKILIIKSSRVKSAEDIQSLNDIIYDKIPEKAVNYFMIEDNRFGEIIFKSEIYNEGDDFIVKNTSTHSLKKYGFTVNGPGEYQFVFFFIYDKKAEGYFYYAMQAARIRSSYLQKISFVSSESFVNRLRAMTVNYAGLMGRNWNERLKQD